jgi:hypothetical protein
MLYICVYIYMHTNRNRWSEKFLQFHYIYLYISPPDVIEAASGTRIFYSLVLFLKNFHI